MPEPLPPAPEPRAPVPLVHVSRGGRLECVHRGHYVIVQDGLVVEQAGDAGFQTYYRSTSKPFQSMACITSGAADRFGFTPAMLALAAGSHNSEPAQLEVARGMLAAAGVEESALCCGGHWSINKQVARAQVLEVGADADPLPAIWSNCSGKHASMLASAVALEAPLGTYVDPVHPAQLEITRVIAACAGVEPEAIGIGCDGCGAPVHAVSLEAMARSLWRLGDPASLPAELGDAAERVGQAMSEHPGMVAGAKRFDTDLMETASMRILSKGGAEGVHGLAVPRLKLGLALKVEDGSDRGYRLVVIELLRRYGALTSEEAEVLAQRHGRTIRNLAVTEVGHLTVEI